MSDHPADLDLPTRDGLPDAIAYLRAAYPTPTWPAHRNYGQLSAFWLQVHASLRQQAGELQQVVRSHRDGQLAADPFQRALVPRLNHFLQHLNGHHQIEDAAYFPKFRALDPRMGAGFALLEHDHEIIHGGIANMVDAARAMLGQFASGQDARTTVDRYAERADALFGLLDRHLADEEELVIPAMLEHGERSVS